MIKKVKGDLMNEWKDDAMMEIESRTQKGINKWSNTESVVIKYGKMPDPGQELD